MIAASMRTVDPHRLLGRCLFGCLLAAVIAILLLSPGCKKMDEAQQPDHPAPDP